MKNAEDKFLFLSFCIEMKRFDAFLNNENVDKFETCLPIRLDGTCNGFQHLALLSHETALFEPLNLSSSDKNKDPEDLYKHILGNINIHLEKVRQKVLSENNDYGFDKSKDEIKNKNIVKYEACTRLLKLGLSRKEIKASIMNKPYNAKDRTLAQYIKDTLKLHHTENINIIDKKGVPKDILIG